MNYNPHSIYDIKKQLENKKLIPQKRFGQNFLIDNNITSKIVDLMDLKKNDLVLEIGGGLGGLTSKLLDTKAMVLSFEIDIGFIKILKEEFSNYNNFILIEGDFLKNFKTNSWKQYIKENSRVIISGNIPYNITKEIFDCLFSSDFQFDIYCFTIQSEIVDRLFALPKTKEYSYISILSRFNRVLKYKFNIDRNNFYPIPNVTSTVVIFEKKRLFELNNFELFVKISKSLFLNRRKKIHNNIMLSTLLSDIEKNASVKVLDILNVDKNMRGEEMDIDFIVKFSNLVYENLIPVLSKYQDSPYKDR